eukprot:CAMPEP_0206489544 /NCGR_PEP_ID=MMETSP0324_2-20121206/43334_1 /ASSEMBLY_ACC=CAM_ASM_000836 /TAXON_ID=2866 /ORGANISM="Crypthecodinium cohnii, Strain Seligo" /LENGTH=190 /DNA_ID=CAMNT_0053969305 /DNA_START=67 /DNA_END=635 /DNA_ORIENTATION=-
MALDPFKADQIWRSAIMKEAQTWKSPDTLRKMTQPLKADNPDERETYYRLPLAGESVRVCGVQRRPELNGALAEVVSSDVDDFGRITVRVFDSTVPGQTGANSRRMKIQPCRLAPSSSSPSLLGLATLREDASSVRSASRCGSSLTRSGASLLSSAGRSSIATPVLENTRPGPAGSTPYHHATSGPELGG